jgi:hypothetical protein
MLGILLSSFTFLLVLPVIFSSMSHRESWSLAFGLANPTLTLTHTHTTIDKSTSFASGRVQFYIPMWLRLENY